MILRQRVFMITLTVALLMAAAISASAQSYLLDPVPDNTYKFGIRYIRPDFEFDIDLSTFSGTYDFYGSVPIGESYTLRVSLPFTRGNSENVIITDEYGSVIGKGVSDHQFGNLFIGGQYRLDYASGLINTLSLGVHLPTAQTGKEVSIFVSAAANPFEIERIYPDLLTIKGNIAVRYEKLNSFNYGFYVGGDFGPMIWIPTGDLSGDPELLFRYGLCAGGRFEKFTFGTEVTGLYVLTEDLEPAAEQFDNFLTIGISTVDLPVRPAIFVTFPLDDEFTDYINLMYGFRLEAAIPRL